MNKHLRVSGSHWKEQAIRFGRLFVAAEVAQLTAIGLDHHIGRSVLISTAIGAVEVAVRQFLKVVPVKDASYAVPPAV